MNINHNIRSIILRKIHTNFRWNGATTDTNPYVRYPSNGSLLVANRNRELWFGIATGRTALTDPPGRPYHKFARTYLEGRQRILRCEQPCDCPERITTMTWEGFKSNPIKFVHQHFPEFNGYVYRNELSVGWLMLGHTGKDAKDVFLEEFERVLGCIVDNEGFVSCEDWDMEYKYDPIKALYVLRLLTSEWDNSAARVLLEPAIEDRRSK